jgi:S1-C subfamily serine protease
MNARIAVTVLALSLALGLPLRAAPEAMDLPALAKKSRPSVLLLSVLDANGKEIATGTGFIISPDGRVVTNYNVIENAATMVAKGENGAYYEVAGVLAQNTTNDIAILKLNANDLPPLPLGDSTNMEEGQPVAVIGSPLGLEGTLSDGIISANREVDGNRILQISAPISPGSSGSPVLDADGDVIGVASAIITKGQALNLAVPIEAVKSLLPPSNAKPSAFSSPKPETQGRSPASEIQSVLNQCAKIAKKASALNVNPAAKDGYVADGFQAIDASRCPQDFRIAFQEHINAWRNAPFDGQEMNTTYFRLTKIAAAYGARIPRSVVYGALP